MLWLSFLSNIYLNTQDVIPKPVLEMYIFEYTNTYPGTMISTQWESYGMIIAIFFQRVGHAIMRLGGSCSR